VDLGLVVIFGREAVPMAASRSVSTIVEELFVYGAVLFADVGGPRWARAWRGIGRDGGF
jgi:hypothetical protein